MAEIICYLVDEHVLMQELFNDELPRFKMPVDEKD